jgi:hypothetical protein
MTAVQAMAEMSFLNRIHEALGGACFGIVLVVIVLLTMRSELAKIQLAKRHRRELASWVQSRGLRFHYNYDDRLAECFEGFLCLQGEENPLARNIYKGSCNGRYVIAFDYSGGVFRPEEKQNARGDFSAVIVTTNLQMKPLVIQPRDLRAGLTEFIGYGDIDFESAEFSREFYVKSPDKRWAYDVLNQAAMELLLASPRFTLQFAETSVIAYNGYRFEASEFEAALTLIEGILQRLPPSLVHELQAGGQNA